MYYFIVALYPKDIYVINLKSKQAAIYIGHPKAGTIISALQAVMGRRVELFLPIGLEKRIDGDINDIARRLNSSGAKGFRYFPVCGNILTELEAINILTGAEAELVAGGGVCGAKGSYWIAVPEIQNSLERGYNRDHELLPQVNVGLLFSQHQKLPVCYELYNPATFHVLSIQTSTLGMHPFLLS